MTYRIIIDGYECYEDTPDLVLLSPTLTMELNAPGSLEFTMPTKHKYYDKPILLKSEVFVYENDNLIWHGRPSEISIDYKKQKKIYCEGALAYLSDSVQTGKVTNTAIANAFINIINQHNSLCGNWHNFRVGNIDIPYVVDSLEYDFDTSWNLIKTLVNDYGGYLSVSKSGSDNVINWTLNSPVTSVHEITFGVNLKDLAQKYSLNDLKTSVIPYGKLGDENKVLLNHDNSSNRIYVDSAAVSTYGRIVGTIDAGDISSVSELETFATSWLQSQQFDGLSLTISAIDLYNHIHDLDISSATMSALGSGFHPLEKFPSFRVGQSVHIYSNPHLIDKILPISKITVKLDTSLKTISIGNKDTSITALSGKSNKKATMLDSKVVDEYGDPIPVPWNN